MRKVRLAVIRPRIMHKLRQCLRRLQPRHLRLRRLRIRPRRDPRSRHIRRRLHIEQPLRCPRIQQLIHGSGFNRQRQRLRHVQPARLIPLAVPHRHRNQPRGRRLRQVARILEHRRSPQNRCRTRALIRIHPARILRMRRGKKCPRQHPSGQQTSGPQPYPELSTP